MIKETIEFSEKVYTKWKAINHNDYFCFSLSFIFFHIYQFRPSGLDTLSIVSCSGSNEAIVYQIFIDFFFQSIILNWRTRSILFVFWTAKWSNIWYRYNDLVSSSSITLWPILDLGFLKHTHLWILSQLHVHAIKIPHKIFLVQKGKKIISKVRIPFNDKI